MCNKLDPDSRSTKIACFIRGKMTFCGSSVYTKITLKECRQYFTTLVKDPNPQTINYAGTIAKDRLLGAAQEIL